MGRKIEGRYAVLARKLPTYLQVSGLGQTLALLASKGRKGTTCPPSQRDDQPRTGDQLLFWDLDDYLRLISRGERSDRRMMDLIVSANAPAYRRATREVQAVADWLKRFAEAELEAEEE
jgi:CRISPR type III-B/RAMP module-associated protein Cmr5